MQEDSLDYPIMIQEALRGVARQALEKVQQHGMPGSHHFYISFRTDHPEVAIGEDLKQRYPEEMTIVLQHQYRDLEIDADSFSVTLNFGSVPRNLVIPFKALTVFSDPSVEFGLQFAARPESEPASAADDLKDEAEFSSSDNVVAFDANRKNR